MGWYISLITQSPRNKRSLKSLASPPLKQVPHCLDYCSFIKIAMKSGSLSLSTLFFCLSLSTLFVCFKITLVILGPYEFGKYLNFINQRWTCDVFPLFRSTLISSNILQFSKYKFYMSFVNFNSKYFYPIVIIIVSFISFLDFWHWLSELLWKKIK